MRTSKERFVVALAIVATLPLAACGGGPDNPTTPHHRHHAPPPPPPDWDEFYGLVREETEALWASWLPVYYGTYYDRISTFRGYGNTVSTPCGSLGPWNAFYCPTNAGVYYHEPFLDQLSNETGPVASAFVIAHEIGHHVSWLLGWIPGYTMSTKQNELQADCFAGAWAGAVDQTLNLTKSHLEQAASAAINVGNPQYTWFDPTIHGTSIQRLKAFADGFLDPAVCTEYWWVSQWPLS